MFSKVLIANRGEIALRILRACRQMGIQTVAVHSTADGDAMHVRLADESVCIGPAASSQSYLNAAAILTAAEISGAQAIHPGFGFLSENADFAQMVQDHGLTFIGPSPDHIAVMGSKARAKQKAVELGLSVIEGSDGQLRDVDHARSLAEKLGYPILLKAVAGGGGKGMRVVWKDDELQSLFNNAQAEALASFGEGGLYMEKFLKTPRHIEFQVLGDHHGNVVCLGDRDCSIQRNHQKIWEEAPSCALTEAQRSSMTQLVVKAMTDFGYRNAGTLEFLYENDQFYFIEMNTRIQVEHPVTEMITGIDLVQEQIKIAAGLPLSFTQSDVRLQGHAIECRINAEDPLTFMPSPGKIDVCLPPGGPFVRVDSALYPGYRVPPYYDSLVAKLVVHGPDRASCLARLRGALDEYVISGIKTLIPLHRNLCEHKDVQTGQVHVKWLEQTYGKPESHSLIAKDGSGGTKVGVNNVPSPARQERKPKGSGILMLTAFWTALGLFGALSLCGCSPKPPKLQGVHYLTRPTALLPASKIQFNGPPPSPGAFAYVPITLADMLRQWSQNGIAPSGAPGTITITITDASVKESRLSKSPGLEGWVRTENTEQYTACIHATMERVGQSGSKKRIMISAQADRYAPENCTLEGRRKIMLCLYEDVLNRFVQEVDRVSNEL
jgi:acetyl-CoA carboxylase, biotin carboxylase subunit